MLNYRHLYHAGNHGDVLKHSVLLLAALQLQESENSVVYIDTHAGAGCYDLRKPWAQKNRAFETGILPLWQRGDAPPALRTYLGIVQKMNPNGELRWYPGSPWLVRQLMRKQDYARLFELHQDEAKTLRTLFENEPNINVDCADGLQALKTVLPPPQRHALVLIDPAYQLHDDFMYAFNALTDAYRRFTPGMYLLWYPLIHRGLTARLENDLRHSDMHNVLRVELEIAPNSTSAMIGSGIVIINPCQALRENLQQLLPYLAERLGRGGKHTYHGTFRIDTLR